MAVYSPVVAASLIGTDRKSLRDDPEYRPVIGVPLRLNDAGGARWTLRRFSGGRYFIERSRVSAASTQLICFLDGRDIVITDVYEDAISGGRYFSAVLKCDAGQEVAAPKNQWHEDLLKARTFP